MNIFKFIDYVSLIIFISITSILSYFIWILIIYLMKPQPLPYKIPFILVGVMFQLTVFKFIIDRIEKTMNRNI
jgi:hypothetical protein